MDPRRTKPLTIPNTKHKIKRKLNLKPNYEFDKRVIGAYDLNFPDRGNLVLYSIIFRLLLYFSK